MRIALQLGVAVLVFGFLVVTVVGQWGELQDKGVRLEPLWLIPAAVILPGFYALGAVAWDLIIRAFGYRLPLAQAQVAWGQPLLARYVPGSVLFVLGRLLLAERAGVSRRICLASLVYEQALSASGALAVASYFLIEHPDLQGHSLRWAVLLVLPAALALLHPRVFGPLANRALRAFGREPLPTTLAFRRVLLLVLFFVGMWAIAGLGVYFVARSVHFVSFSELPTVAAAQAFGYLATLATLVAPAGLGIRDAAFAWAVKAALPSGSFAVGAVIAIAVRTMQTLAEVVYVAIVTAVARHSGGALPALGDVEAESEGADSDRDPGGELVGAEGQQQAGEDPVARERR